MEYEKARKILKELKDKEKDNELQKALEIGEFSTMKRIPRKFNSYEPVFVKSFDDDTKTIKYFKCLPCPVCDKWIIANETNKYCSKCGQAVLWEGKL